MADARIYHPELDTTVDVPEESVPQLRMSGWLLASEWEAQRTGPVPAEQAPAGWVPAPEAKGAKGGKAGGGKTGSNATSEEK